MTAERKSAFLACEDCGRPDICERLGECNLLVPPASSAKGAFDCPGCGEESFPDEVGVVTCECGAHIETLEPLGLRRILPSYWTRLRGSVAPLERVDSVWFQLAAHGRSLEEARSVP